jgi:hypothetical protein
VKVLPLFILGHELDATPVLLDDLPGHRSADLAPVIDAASHQGELAIAPPLQDGEGSGGSFTMAAVDADGTRVRKHGDRFFKEP